MKRKHVDWLMTAFFVVAFAIVMWSGYVIMKRSHDCRERGGYPTITRTDVICLDREQLK